MADLLRRRDEAVGADLVELRLDGVGDLEVASALAHRRLPVIVTCRPVWEGGRFAGSETDRLSLLQTALDRGAEFVDIEWRAEFAGLVAATGGRRVVLSFHDFDGCPADLTERARAMLATGADVVKIAVRARRLTDCLALLETARALDAPGRLVLIAMGEYGITTRVCAAKFGAAWTYAGQVPGVGQVDLPTLVNEYRFRSIGAATELYGVIGQPVSHSVSPAMHNAAFGASRRDAVYVPLPATDVADAVAFVNGFRMKGASITIPYKVALVERMDDIDETARRIGAVNTLRIDHGRWLGMNSDALGFLQPLVDRALDLRRLRASVLGAGGSARAVVSGLVRSGAMVTVHARRRAAAEALAGAWSVAAGPWPPDPGSWDLLVNCTPMGLHPAVENSPVPLDRLTGRLVYDLVYNPVETRLLREASHAGCEVIGGLDMLVAQAQEQSQWWTGARPAADVMRSAARRRLQECQPQ